MRTLLLVLSLPAVVGMSQGCVVTVERDVIHFPDAVDEIQLDLAAGDVEIVVEDRDDVVVERTQRFMRSEPRLVAELRDHVLSLEVHCAGLGGNCGADHVVRLPRSAVVVGHTGAGDARLVGLTQTVDMESDAGDIELEKLSGEVLLHTKAGDVDGFGLSSPTLVIATDAGDVDLELLRMADLVFVDTAAGDVDILTPAGAYEIVTDTKAGDIQLDGVQRDGSSPHAIEVHTSAGDIDIVGR